MPPRVIGHYEILGVLGTGGIGCVYRALDQRTLTTVALKLLSSGPALDAAAARRMAREFEALSDLSHPNIVRVYDTGVHRGYPYLVMELIEGLTLREFLQLDETGSPAMFSRKARPRREEEDASSEEASAEGPDIFDLDQLAREPDSDPGFALEDTSDHGPEALRRLADAIDEPFTDDELSSDELAWTVRRAEPDLSAAPARAAYVAELSRPERIALLKDAVIQICEALAYIHSHGMVHRDLKPSNIMVDEDRRVRLMDFGLAKFLAEEHAVTAAGRIVGTYRYMAPEQLLGEPIDGRTDLYSLGVMLYELLAGRPPFDARTPLEMCRKVLEQDPVALRLLNPDMDEPLARIAHRLMLKDPADRYQTAEEVSEVLQE